MNYGSEPADQVVRYSLEGAEFALRISGMQLLPTAASFIIRYFLSVQDLLVCAMCW